MKINSLKGFFIKILPCIALLSSCGNARYEAEYQSTLPNEVATSASDSASIVQQVNNNTTVQQTLKELDSELAEKLSQKKFIYHVNMKAKVRNVAQETTQIWRLARKFGGYITSSEVNTHLESSKSTPLSADSLMQVNSYSVENRVTMRVPISNLDTTLLELNKLYYFLENHHIKAQDVTFALLENQLKIKLYNQSTTKMEQVIEKKGENLEDISKVEDGNMQKKAHQINQQITKLNLLDAVAFATIEIQFYQMPLTVVDKIENPNTDRYEPSFEMQLTDSLRIGWKLVLAMIVHVAKIWFLIPIAIFAYWGYRRYYR